jgi:hypothetical protein
VLWVQEEMATKEMGSVVWDAVTSTGMGVVRWQDSRKDMNSAQ